MTTKRDLAMKNESINSMTVTDLKEKYGSTYTPLQYCIWVELIDGKLASSAESPMLTRAGRGGSTTLCPKLPSKYPAPLT